MNNKQHENMSHEELTLEYFKYLIGLDVSLYECIGSAADFGDTEIGEYAAKIILKFNMLACSAIAELYVQELEIGNKEADLFRPCLVELNIDYNIL